MTLPIYTAVGFQLDISMQKSNLGVFVGHSLETSTQCSVTPKRQVEQKELFGKE